MKPFVLLWKDHALYLKISAFLMFFGGACGFYLADEVQRMLDPMLRELEELAREMQGAGALSLFRTIFLNNLIAAVTVLFLGSLFAVFPIYALIVNGMAVGYLLWRVEESGLNAAQLFLYGIVPHGIFEIPAILLAAAFGLRWGVAVVRAVLHRLGRKEGSAVAAMKPLIAQIPAAILNIVFLLVVAAIVESTLTPLLIERLAF